MKVIFLDIDGVLNTNQMRMDWGIDFISPRMVRILADIIGQTGAYIVLSSTWRLKTKDLLLVREALTKADIAKHWIGVTPDWNNNPDVIFVDNVRVAEIKLWLAGQPTAIEFAVLDDLNLPIENLFLCDDNIGLTADIAVKVVEHLGKEGN